MIIQRDDASRYETAEGRIEASPISNSVQNSIVESSAWFLIALSIKGKRRVAIVTVYLRASD